MLTKEDDTYYFAGTVAVTLQSRPQLLNHCYSSRDKRPLGREKLPTVALKILLCNLNL